MRQAYSILTPKKLHTYSSYAKRERVLRRLARAAKVPKRDNSQEPAWYYDESDCPAACLYDWKGYEFNSTLLK